MRPVPVRLPRSLGDAEVLLRHDPLRWPALGLGGAIVAAAGAYVHLTSDYACGALAGLLGLIVATHHAFRSCWYLAGYEDGWAARTERA